jgi:DNA-directed RNA polymerase subunit alpha
MLEPTFHTKTEDKNENYAKLVFEPLTSSFANSIGNALRRTLLSSLPGAAIGYVKFNNAPHFFTTIPGVKESVLDIVLNLKQVRFSTTSEGPFRMTLSTKGAKKIYAKDLTGEAEVVNGDLYLGEITDDKGAIDLEAIVEVGYGFIPSEEKESPETGFVAVDSSFSPVRRVNFKVEEARVGRKSNFERLIIEVWTDGSISPDQAVKDSAAVLAKQFSYIFSDNEVSSGEQLISAQDAQKEEKDSKMYETIIDELNLPSRVINALLRENIETVADLVKRGKEDLVGLKGVGRKSIDLIEEELQKMGVELK